MEPSKAKNPVRSLLRADEILTTLKERDGARLADLEDEIDLSKGTIHSYLATLEQCGLVAKRGQVYDVGYKCLELGGYVRDREPLYVGGREGADELADETGELAALVTEHGGRCTWLYQSTGNDAVPMDSYLGVQMPMHCTASGKAMLAELPDDEVEAIIDRHGLPAWTENTLTGKSELFEQLEEIRETGVAFEDEERISGLRGIGVSIRKEGTLLGALAIAGPVNRLEGDWYWEELPEQVTKVQRMIEVKITYESD